MSDIPQEHQDSAADSTQQTTENIIENLQTLTDIEGDLADTAVAVVSDGLSNEQSVEHSAVTSAEGPGASETLIQNAEVMEDILEQSIPDAPTHEEQTEEQSHEQVIQQEQSTSTENASSMEIDQPIPNATIISEDIPSQSSTAVAHDPSINVTEQSDSQPTTTDEVKQVIENVAADITQPILPEEVPSVAENDGTVKEETKSELSIPAAEGTNVPSSEQEETKGNIVTNGTTMSTTEQDTPLPQLSSIPSLPPKPSFSTSVAPHLVTAEAETADMIKPGVPLPEGITESSPSVVSNPAIVRDWQRDPNNGHIILAFFRWSIQNSEAADAQAWYNFLAVENPTATQPLLELINLQSALTNFSAVEGLFARALKGPSGGVTAAADVSIWKEYLHYIRRQNPVGSGGNSEEETKRKTITEAYEFALKQCGVDRDAGEIWQEYIAFTQESKPKNTWEIQAQQDNLRKLFQRAVCIPLSNVETLWKSYDAFESGISKVTAKKFLAERSPAYMTARTALRELRTLTDPLPHPVLPPRPSFSEQDRQVVSGWKAYLKWEESNPLVIEDSEVLANRIGYAFRRCLAEMRHFPELWHFVANHYLKSSKLSQAAEVVKAGVEACPKSILLTFAAAEIEEDRKDLPAAHQLFNSLLDKLSVETEELKETIAQEAVIAKGPEIPKPKDETDMDDIALGQESAYSRLVEERENRGKMVEERRGREVLELQNAMGVIWVMYMRFARRAEGIKAARAVFGKARKSNNLTWHIFEASAMLEYHTNKDSAVAIRIFELGFKQFAEDVDYVVKYLQFLLDINDDTNARALFERSASKIPADQARPLFDAWAKYEYMFGDLGAVQRLENRFAEIFPNDSPLKRFAQRFSYNGLDQIASRDLGFGRIRSSNASQPSFIPPTDNRPPNGLSAIPHPLDSVNSPIKRPLPGSPTPRSRNSIERSHSPSRDTSGPNKRYRTNSPRRNGVSQREASRDYRGPPTNQPSMPLPPPPGIQQQMGRDRSPMPNMPLMSTQPIPPPGRVVSGGQYGNPTPPPISQGPVGGAYGGALPPREGWDRSGVGKGLAWFVGQLPSSRTFDGPIFRPDDIMGLFSSIGVDGLGAGRPPQMAPPPIASGYNDPRLYGGPPPPRRY